MWAVKLSAVLAAVSSVVWFSFYVLVFCKALQEMNKWQQGRERIGSIQGIKNV